MAHRPGAVLRASSVRHRTSQTVVGARASFLGRRAARSQLAPGFAKGDPDCACPASAPGTPPARGGLGRGADPHNVLHQRLLCVARMGTSVWRWTRTARRDTQVLAAMARRSRAQVFQSPLIEAPERRPSDSRQLRKQSHARAGAFHHAMCMRRGRHAVSCGAVRHRRKRGWIWQQRSRASRVDHRPTMDDGVVGRLYYDVHVRNSYITACCCAVLRSEDFRGSAVHRMDDTRHPCTTEPRKDHSRSQ